jgi:hypothetical protein
LRFVDRLKNQLLISHVLAHSTSRIEAKQRSSHFLELSPQLLFQGGTYALLAWHHVLFLFLKEGARIAGASCFNP